MSQKTLDNWLGIKNNKTIKQDVINIKKYFYINWNNEYEPNNAIWLNIKPENVNFESSIKCDKFQNGFEFILCGYFKDINNKYIISKEKKYRNVPFIKSHLQKTIRQMEDLLALQTASHFIHMDIISFLRRLPIIMLEDVYLNISMNNIIWLMVALSSTHFTIKKYIIEYLLGVIHNLVTNKNIDLLDEINESDPIVQIDTTNILYFNKFNKLSEQECSLMYSLSLRKVYGGTKFDMDLINKYILKWYNRFCQNIDNCYKNDLLYAKINFINDNISELPLDKWMLSAIDFHCSDLINYIKKKYNYYSEEELKKIIWYNLSCKNKRFNQKNSYSNEFKPIKDYVQHLQKYLLMKGY
jgi:hypothetical protein